MPQFDSGLWYGRAAQRFQKAVSEGRQDSAERLLVARDAIRGLETVIDWCTAHGLRVNFGRGANGAYERNDMLITVNGRLEPERQLCVLLHECGHHLIGVRSPSQRFGHGHSDAEASSHQNMVHRVDVVDEELEAWHRGLKLAQRLQIDMNLDKYNRVRVEYIRTYLQWALRAGKER